MQQKQRPGFVQDGWDGKTARFHAAEAAFLLCRAAGCLHSVAASTYPITVAKFCRRVLAQSAHNGYDVSFGALPAANVRLGCFLLWIDHYLWRCNRQV